MTMRSAADVRTRNREAQKRIFCMPKIMTNWPFNREVIPKRIATMPKMKGNWPPRPRMSLIICSLAERYRTKIAWRKIEATV